MISLFLALATTSVRGATPEAIEFNRDIRPILSDKCFACHGLDASHRKAKLRLDIAEGAYKQTDEGPAIAPGDLAKSLSWARIISDDPDEVMPPPETHKKITPGERELIKKWIEQGAKYQQHWSFEPIRNVEPPAADGNGRKNAIDAFLRARLRAEGLKPADEADRATLARRAAFALTGLPPTPAELDAFLADRSPDAYERLVDRYLASPRFGEEMARHWLDVARYADTHGLHLDNERQMWAYRDWVVKAFNSNLPFDRFTVEQVAGDLLPDAGKPAPTRDQLIATGFNRCNVTTSEGGAIPAEYAHIYAVDRTSTLATAFTGLTAGCAVCHDHKFDPISASEFYSLYAFFNSPADPAMDGNALLTKPTIRLSTPEQEKELAALDRQLDEQQAALDKQTAALAYVDPATINPKPAAQTVETVWVEDSFPAGAKLAAGPGGPTQWVTAADDGVVFSGKRALRRVDTGLAQDYFESGAVLSIPPKGEIFAHVYLDPKNPPRGIMLQFHKGQWKHRAVWGDLDAFVWGKPGTAERAHAGPLPALGQWTRIQIPIEKVGLKPGDQITGLALTQFGGTVTWDKVGIIGRIDAVKDPAYSLSAWWASRVGKDTPDAPAAINKLIKAGPEKTKKPSEIKQVRDYYLQNVCATSKAELAGLAAEVESIRKNQKALTDSIPATFVYNDMPKPNDTFVKVRGDYTKNGQKVEPGTPAFLPPLKKAIPQGRATRLDLANWLVSPEHPLTARVAVNRIWQQFFGVGIVKTAGDFGNQGEPPMHPELLDYLAASFRDGGWDVKSLVRQIVTSAAFRQSSFVTPELLTRDPENRLLARGPRMRLDAEQIRDNALFVSGLIVDDMGGVGTKTYQPPNIWEPVGFGGSNTRIYKQDSGPALYRRSIYSFIKRTAPPPFMSNFDAPNREQSCTGRERSNTPLQALQLMNDVQQFEAARALAERMLTEGGDSITGRLTFAYRTVLSRTPDEAEIKILSRQFAAHLDRYNKDEAAAKQVISAGESKPNPKLKPAELAACTMVASTVMNLDETLNRN